MALTTTKGIEMLRYECTECHRSVYVEPGSDAPIYCPFIDGTILMKYSGRVLF